MTYESYVQCNNCSVSKFCLARTLSESDIEKLDGLAQRRQPIRAEETLYQIGEHFKGLYAVRSGSFKSVAISENGASQITGFAFPGEILGFDAYNGKTHPSYAEALETSTVCYLPVEDLDKLCMSVPALQRQITNLFSGEIQQYNNLLLLIGKGSAEERLAALLINISNRLSQRGYSSTQFRLSMSRTDIANYLGLSIETISRLISKLQKKNLVNITHRDVKILDIATLAALSGVSCELSTEQASS